MGNKNQRLSKAQRKVILSTRRGLKTEVAQDSHKNLGAVKQYLKTQAR